MLVGGARIIKTKMRDVIRESAPRYNKSSFVLVLSADIDLIIAKESIHEG